MTSELLSDLSEADLVLLRDQTAEKLAHINAEIVRRKKSSQSSGRKTEGVARVLSNAEISRFSRQLLLPDFGVCAQSALLSSSFLLVGCGGLGCPAAQYLAAAGAGDLGLVDHDTVEESNLHRQVLHTERGLGINKAESIKRAVKGR